MDVMEYKPCRCINAYRTLNDGKVIVITFDGMIKLNGSGKLLWMSANGKRKIREILDIIWEQCPNADYETMKEGLFNLIRQLQKKGILIPNWDPLYKSELSQEI